jgi:hypothetical protein
MPLHAHWVNPEDGSRLAFRRGVSPLDRRERRGKTAPFGHQEPIGRNAESSVVVKTAPASSFIMSQSEFLFQFLVIALDYPAMFGQSDQILKLQSFG